MNDYLPCLGMQRTLRVRQTYDHRLRDTIAATGNAYLFRNVSIPASMRRTRARREVRPVLAALDVELEVYDLWEQFTDGGSENLGEVDQLLEDSRSLRRVLAQIDIVCSNSMIEAFWRQLKHAWLFLDALDTTAAVRRLVAFYVEEHNEKNPPRRSRRSYTSTYSATLTRTVYGTTSGCSRAKAILVCE